MNTEQIYELVNEVGEQALGKTAISVVDTSSLVALGDAILSSQTNTEIFTNTLVQRIGLSIVDFRAYRNKMAKLVLNDFQFGAIVQKIKVDMPEATEEESTDLVDGESIDMFKVAKPKVKQKLFVSRTPYKFFVTIQTTWLEEAFTSETAMGSFISAIYGEVQNKLEVTLENLGRLSMCNYIANAGETQVVNLVTDYNTKTGNTLTADTALFDADFLRYAIGQINLISTKMSTMSTLYNKEEETRHTPFESQFYATLADFTQQLATVVQYGAFNEKYVNKVTDLDVPYWQNAKSPFTIKVNVLGEAGEAEKTVNNVVAFIFDRNALGTYKRKHKVINTPINASGDYFNVYWHEQQLWFNDLSENGVIFTLN